MSETIKVLCYKSKTLSNGEHPLMLCVCKDNKRKYQSLGISIKAEQWDFKNNCPNDKCPNRERIIILINDRINEIQKIALDKRIAGQDFTASTLIESSKPSNNSKKTVGEYYLTYIDNLKKENRIRYAGMYEISYNSFIKFNKHLDIPFSDIDVAWLKRYEAWSKEHNLSVSAISTRLRHLRAIFNLALLEQAIKIHWNVLQSTFLHSPAGVSTSIISESLGHSSERITQVYLDSFDNEQIDNAMKNLL